MCVCHTQAAKTSMHIDNYVASRCSWRWRTQQPTAGTAAATTASCRTVAHVEYVASSMALTTTRKFDSFNVLPHTSMRALAPTQQHISSPMPFIQSLCTWRTLFNSIPKYSSVSMYTSSPLHLLQLLLHWLCVVASVLNCTYVVPLLLVCASLFALHFGSGFCSFPGMSQCFGI